MTTNAAALAADHDETAIIDRIRAGDVSSYAALFQRYNQRVFRAVRSILRDEPESEDVVQQAWVAALENLDRFRGDAAFATWLTRIAVNEALTRHRRRRRMSRLLESVAELGLIELEPSPEQEAASGEIRSRLEAAIDGLPSGYRTVFVLREVEGLDTDETAVCLGLRQETVRVRLHRARRMLQDSLPEYRASEAYRFAGERCARTARIVLERLGIALAV
jgi:RNA polymerase sigma-70 factor (ECF subfamily)